MQSTTKEGMTEREDIMSILTPNTTKKRAQEKRKRNAWHTKKASTASNSTQSINIA